MPGLYKLYVGLQEQNPKWNSTARAKSQFILKYKGQVLQRPSHRGQLNFHGSAIAESNILLNRAPICMGFFCFSILFWGFFKANIQKIELLSI